MSDVEAPPDAPWPPESCPGWCTSGIDGHREEPHRCDRHHSDYGIDVDLSIPYPLASGGESVGALTIGIWQFPEGDPLVDFSTAQGTILLTRSEAAKLAAALKDRMAVAFSDTPLSELEEQRLTHRLAELMIEVAGLRREVHELTGERGPEEVPA